MIKTETVFVLGAGASHAYGLPLGWSLWQSMIGLDSEYVELLNNLGFTRADYQTFQNQLDGSVPRSIDKFLADRPEFDGIGRVLIAARLLRQEQEAQLRRREENWYAFLLDRMGSLNDLKRNNLSIVTFNYDRSFEQFMLSTLRYRTDRPTEEIAEKIGSIPIVHVYGKLGPLEWQVNPREPSVPYGGELNATTVRLAADSIKTIHNEGCNTPEFERARGLLREAERIEFLGFHYHKENMDRLQLPLKNSRLYNPTRIIRGTSLGLIEEDKVKIETQYEGLVLPRYPAAPKDLTVLEYLRRQSDLFST